MAGQDDNITTESFFRCAQGKRHLIDLELAGSSITAHDARVMADLLKVNSSLMSFNLKGSPIGDEGAQHIADALKVNTTLRLLNLDGCGITSVGKNYIRKCNLWVLILA